MKMIYKLVISIIFITGCGTTYMVNNKDFTYEDLNKEIEGQQVTLAYINGGKDIGKNVRVYSDSTYIEWMILENEYVVKNRKVPTASLKEISNKRRGRGAAKGLGYGLLAGVTFGFFAGYAGYDESDTGWFSYNSPQEAGIFAGIVYGLLFGSTGLIVGGLNGDVESFYFPQAEIEDTSSVKVEFSKIVKKDLGYLIIMYQGKEIHLISSEYRQISESMDGRTFITVPKEIYAKKFK